MRFDEGDVIATRLLRALSTFKDVVQSGVDYQKAAPVTTRPLSRIY